MKTFSFATLLGSLLIITSCTKPANNPGGGAQSWTFKSTTYTTQICVTDTTSGLTITASSSAAGNNVNTFSQMSCIFYGSTLPASNGTYIVASDNLAPSAIPPNQVQLSVTTGGLSSNRVVYESTGGNGQQVVNVTVSGGKLSISGTGITMENINGILGSAAADISTLEFNVTQTQ